MYSRTNFLSSISNTVKREGDEYRRKMNLADTAPFVFASSFDQRAAEGAS